MSEKDGRYIVLFDGVCNLCNESVNFIIKRDPGRRFAFAPVQSVCGQDLIDQFNVPEVGVDTFLLIKQNHCYFKSDAALEIAKDLQGAWFLLYVFKIIPRPLRDFIYGLIAKNRYRLFGKKQVCMIPSVENKGRFLSKG